MRRVLAYRIYTDLERGWRVTMPNLEQTGLLRFGYVDVPDIAADRLMLGRDRIPSSKVTRPTTARSSCASCSTRCAGRSPSRQTCSPVKGSNAPSRSATCSSPAPGRYRRTSRRCTPAPCSPRPSAPGGRREAVHFTGRGALGRYLRQPAQFPNRRGRLSRRRGAAGHQGPASVLTELGLLTEADRGYRLKASSLIWLAGDGRDRCAGSAAQDRRSRGRHARQRVLLRPVRAGSPASSPGLSPASTPHRCGPRTGSSGKPSSVTERCRCCTARRQWSSAWTSPT